LIATTVRLQRDGRHLRCHRLGSNRPIGVDRRR